MYAITQDANNFGIQDFFFSFFLFNHHHNNSFIQTKTIYYSW